MPDGPGPEFLVRRELARPQTRVQNPDRTQVCLAGRLERYEWRGPGARIRRPTGFSGEFLPRCLICPERWRREWSVLGRIDYRSMSVRQGRPTQDRGHLLRPEWRQEIPVDQYRPG